MKHNAPYQWTAWVLLILCPLTLTQGCGTWRTVDLPMMEVLGDGQPHKVRMERPSVREASLVATHAHRDTICGRNASYTDLTLDPPRKTQPPEPACFSLSDFDRVRVLESNPQGTILAVVGLALMASLAVWAISDLGY